MALSTTHDFKFYNGNGVTTLFPVDFQFGTSAELVVTLISAAGVETPLTISTHYTVSGGGAVNPAIGTLTMLTPPATGERLLIQRATALSQSTVHTNNDAFPAKTVEGSYDARARVEQETRTLALRSLKLSMQSHAAGVSAILPTPEAGKALQWNADGTALINGTASEELGTIPVSSFAQTFLDDTTAQAVLNTLGLYGIVTPEQHGAVGYTGDDGVSDADDTVALQAALTDAIDNKKCLIIARRYKITSGLNGYPTNTYAVRFLPGGSIRVAYTGVAGVAFKGTHPTVPSTRGNKIYWFNGNMQMHSSITEGQIGPCFFEKRYVSGVNFIGDQFFFHGRGNTIIRLSGVFNGNLGGASCWQGGIRFPIKATTGITFSIASASTTLTSSASHFAASDVGKAIMLDGAPDELFVIATYVDVDEVTVTRAAQQAFSGVSGVWSDITGSVNASSTALTISHDVLSASDVGRVILIFNALDLSGGVLGVFRTTIAAVAGTAITLAAAPTASVTDAMLQFSPDVEIYGEDTTNNITNDIKWDDLHIEQSLGCGLFMQHAVGVKVPNLKLHGQNDVWTNRSSSFNAIFCNCYGVIGITAEGTVTNPLGRIHVSGQRGDLKIDHWQGSAQNGQQLLYGENNHSAGSVTIGDIGIVNAPLIPVTTEPFRWVGSGALYRIGRLSTNSGQTAAPAGYIAFRGAGSQAAAVVARRYGHINSGAPANGIGALEECVILTSADNPEVAGQHGFIATDVTGGSEDFDYVLRLMIGGAAAAEVLRVKSTKTILLDSTQILKARVTGWTVASGTAQRAGFATYTAANISASPTEAEVQAVADGLQDVSRTLKALIDDLHGTAGHGLIGT